MSSYTLLNYFIEDDAKNGFGEKWDAFKGAVVGIWDIFGIIADVLGFVGLRVGILLIVTLLFLWFLNTISPLDKKINYILGIMVGIFIGFKAQMPFLSPKPIIAKYLLIVLSPFIISYIVHYVLKFFKWLLFSKSPNLDNSTNITKKNPPNT